MTLTFALAQSNFTVGDIAGNRAKIVASHEVAAAAAADLLVCTEMCLTGYPPEDLVLRKDFQRAAMQAVEALALQSAQGPAMLVGGLWAEEGALYNAVFLMENGKIAHRQYKYHLPNYGVFDEKRVFVPGPLPEPCIFRGASLGLLICEDMWQADVAGHLKARGAQILLSLNASPFELGKPAIRRATAAARVRETGLPVIYVNQAGGQDELVFDGGSFALSASAAPRARLHAFAEDFALVTFERDLSQAPLQPEYGEEEAIYRALLLGLRDFVHKNGFTGVVLGMSGGIDSAFSAAVAADALGPQNVRCLMMPSPFTSNDSLEDAADCAARLGIQIDTVSIAPAMQAFHSMLAGATSGTLKDITEQNIQPRLRGAILMGISNNEGLLLLTTGNKSEMSVGYATLYGDMCGGYSVLKDIYKTTVYALSRWRNLQGEAIPERILAKAPTAELKAGQTDQDTLPPYDVLDGILKCLIERQCSVEETAAEGFDPATVKRVALMLFAAEYKRRQAPPGVKITPMAFGRDRRYPIASGWKG